MFKKILAKIYLISRYSSASTKFEKLDNNAFFAIPGKFGIWRKSMRHSEGKNAIRYDPDGMGNINKKRTLRKIRKRTTSHCPLVLKPNSAFRLQPRNRQAVFLLPKELNTLFKSSKVKPRIKNKKIK